MIKLSELQTTLLIKRIEYLSENEKTYKRTNPGRFLLLCRKLNFEEYLYNEDIKTNEIQQEKKCDLNTKLPKRCFNPSKIYMSILKKALQIY